MQEDTQVIQAEYISFSKCLLSRSRTPASKSLNPTQQVMYLIVTVCTPKMPTTVLFFFFFFFFFFFIIYAVIDEDEDDN